MSSDMYAANYETWMDKEYPHWRGNHNHLIDALRKCWDACAASAAPAGVVELREFVDLTMDGFCNNDCRTRWPDVVPMVESWVKKMRKLIRTLEAPQSEGGEKAVDAYILLNAGEKTIQGDEVYYRDEWKPIEDFYRLYVELPADVMTLGPVRRAVAPKQSESEKLACPTPDELEGRKQSENCPECGGDGKVMEGAIPTFYICSRCRGTGKRQPAPKRDAEA